MEPRYVRHLAGYSPNHQVELLQGQGHLPMRSAPQTLALLIRSWLEEQGLGSQATEGPSQSLAKPRSWRSANCA
jgi:hypothetical protein